MNISRDMQDHGFTYPEDFIVNITRSPKFNFQDGPIPSSSKGINFDDSVDVKNNIYTLKKDLTDHIDTEIDRFRQAISEISNRALSDIRAREEKVDR